MDNPKRQQIRKTKNYLDKQELLAEVTACRKAFIKAASSTHKGETDPEKIRLARNLFGNTHGGRYMSPRLAELIMLMVEHIAMMGSYRNYSYVADLQSTAYLRCVLSYWKFDYERTDQAFSWFTSVIERSFWTYLKDEKKGRSYRDDELEKAGFEPSHTRQRENEVRLEQKNHEFLQEFRGEPIPVVYDNMQFKAMIKEKQKAREEKNESDDL